MIGTQPTGTLPGVVIHAVAHEGLRVTVDGAPAQLAIVTADGRIVALGQEVADEAENVSVNSYRAFLLGRGHVRLMGKPIERSESSSSPVIEREEIDTVGLAAEPPLNREHSKKRRVTKR
jgi:hypothetical protein